MGLLSVALPAGEHLLEVVYAGTWLQWIGELISLGAWLVLAVGGVWLLLNRGRRRPLPAATAPGWRTVGAIAAVILGVILLHELAPGWFRLSSPADQALPAHTPLAEVFGGQVRVLGVDPPPATVAPGETLATTVYLQATQPLTTNYGLFLHLDSPNGTTIAAVDVQHPDDIPTRNWPPGLYVRTPLRLTAPADALPMRYDLQLGMTDPASGEWLHVGRQRRQAAQVGFGLDRPCRASRDTD